MLAYEGKVLLSNSYLIRFFFNSLCISKTGKFHVVSDVLERAKIKLVARLKYSLSSFPCHIRSYKKCKKHCFFEKNSWKFYSKFFYVQLMLKKHTIYGFIDCLTCKLIFRNFWDFLIALCGKATYRACWRRFHHMIPGRLRYSHPLNNPLTSYNSRC